MVVIIFKLFWNRSFLNCFDITHGKIQLNPSIFDIFVLTSLVFTCGTRAVEHRSWNRDGYTPPTPHPLKIIWKFFVELILFRKQSLNFSVVFFTFYVLFYSLSLKLIVYMYAVYAFIIEDWLLTPLQYSCRRRSWKAHWHSITPYIFQLSA